MEATISHISPTKVPKMPKPILKSPSFELGEEVGPTEQTWKEKMGQSKPGEKIEDLVDPLTNSTKEEAVSQSEPRAFVATKA